MPFSCVVYYKRLRNKKKKKRDCLKSNQSVINGKYPVITKTGRRLMCEVCYVNCVHMHDRVNLNWRFTSSLVAIKLLSASTTKLQRIINISCVIF